MIVREHSSGFIMIEQDHHAHLSGEMAMALRNEFFAGKKLRQSVEYAIHQHDYGWKMLDKQPFWNDKQQAPYTFTDFPVLPKMVFYKHGIDEVEKQDAYAGLLCSRHYTGFLLNDSSKEAKSFVKEEKNRQKQIFEDLEDIDRETYNFHYGLVQLFDNLSLFLCLNEPGASKDNEHPFFREGIPLSESLAVIGKDKMDIWWEDVHTVFIGKPLFDTAINLNLRQKYVTKESIAAKGLIESYQVAKTEEKTIEIKAKDR
ncbi:DUF3891 family protein [Virgibacillus kekensis]|uniref:DUF3891 family protein n=1 Tax=Virgibacillus kekensis TaxID=202261 RepID=A0ABV9DL24_9BACI